MDTIEWTKKMGESVGSGWLPAPAVQTLITDTGVTIEQLMLELIPLASSLALPRLSGFCVGAVAQGVSGALYFGANLEFETGPLNLTVHAEQATVINAMGHGEASLIRLAVSAAPCGFCRQFLFELSGANGLQILLAGKKSKALPRLLPGAFGPKDLGVTGQLLTPERHSLEWVSPCAGPGAAAALDAARAAYAPYTAALAGAALVMHDNRTFAGSYLENAASNPTIGPMQSAVVAAVLARASVSSVAEAVIVQVEGSKIDHARNARFILEKLAPAVVLRELWARKTSTDRSGG